MTLTAAVAVKLMAIKPPAPAAFADKKRSRGALNRKRNCGILFAEIFFCVVRASSMAPKNQGRKQKMAEENEKDQAAPEPPKKSKAMLFIILGVAVLLLGGGGFFAYTKMMAKPAGDQPPPPAKPEPVVGEIYSLSPFTVNLADPKGRRYLKLKIQIEVKDEKTLETVQKADPILRDQVIMLLTSLSFEEVMTPEGKIRIREELIDRFNRVLRPSRVKNIYFTEFIVQ